jgi:hypothetical protein
VLSLKRFGGLTRLKKYFFNLVFVLTTLIVFGFIIYQIFISYFDWLKDPFSRFLLPPYRSISYFLIYALPRLFFPFLIAFIFALIFWRLAAFLNRRSGEIFFEPEEPVILALAIFLSGYPGFLIYFIVLILIFLIFNLVLSLYHILAKKASLKNLPRFPLYFFWLPAAIFAIIIKSWLSSKGVLLFFNL